MFKDFEQNCDMNIVVRLLISVTTIFYIPQVFKESSTYKGKMKDLCEKMFLQYYGDMLGVNKFIESQVTYQDNIAYNVR